MKRSAALFVAAALAACSTDSTPPTSEPPPASKPAPAPEKTPPQGKSSEAKAQEGKPAPDPKATGEKAAGDPKTPPAGDAGAANPAAKPPGPLAQIDAFIAEKKIDKTGNWKTHLPKPPKLTFDDQTYYWMLKTNKGDIKIKLLPKAAPMHVSNVIYLTRLGFYDGLKFHRAIKGFMAQGGDPAGNGSGGPGYHIDLEVNPELNHDHPGVVSTARTPDPNSAGSQFFIMYARYPSLDQQYSIFGDVVSGMETVKAMEKVSADRDGAPAEELRIESASIQAESL